MQAWPDGSQWASKPSSISSTLLEQLRAGGPEAWQRLVRLYGPVIYRWCRRSNLTAEDAADIVQDVLSAVMVHLPNFRRDRPQDSFSGWLATITRNKVRELYRRRQGKAEARGGSTALQQMAEIAQPEPESGKGDCPLLCEAGHRPEAGRGPFRQMGTVPFSASEESIQPDAQSAACLSRRVLELIRAEFEARTWDVFWRVSVGGESPAHVADDLKMNVAAVYKAKSRVLGRFRQILAELPE
jgi:RNA polymerase sigma-70 factor, ECF subfamily